MSRRELREQIFKMLFRIEFHEGMEMEEQIAALFRRRWKKSVRKTANIFGISMRILWNI